MLLYLNKNNNKLQKFNNNSKYSNKYKGILNKNKLQINFNIIVLIQVVMLKKHGKIHSNLILDRIQVLEGEYLLHNNKSNNNRFISIRDNNNMNRNNSNNSQYYIILMIYQKQQSKQHNNKII